MAVGGQPGLLLQHQARQVLLGRLDASRKKQRHPCEDAGLRQGHRVPGAARRLLGLASVPSGRAVPAQEREDGGESAIHRHKLAPRADFLRPQGPRQAAIEQSGEVAAEEAAPGGEVVQPGQEPAALAFRTLRDGSVPSLAPQPGGDSGQAAGQAGRAPARDARAGFAQGLVSVGKHLAPVVGVQENLAALQAQMGTPQGVCLGLDSLPQHLQGARATPRQVSCLPEPLEQVGIPILHALEQLVSGFVRVAAQRQQAGRAVAARELGGRASTLGVKSGDTVPILHVARPRLEGSGQLEAGCLALGRAQAGLGRLADAMMREAGSLHQVAHPRRGQRFARGDAKELLEHGRLEGQAQQRCPGQHPGMLGSQRAQPQRDQDQQIGGQLEPRKGHPVALPAAPPGKEGCLVQSRAQELPHAQRGPVSAALEVLEQAVIQLSLAQHLGAELDELGALESRQLQCGPVSQPFQGGGWLARGKQEEQRSAMKLPRQPGQHLEGGRIQPLSVLDHQRERLGLGHPDPPLRQGIMRLAAAGRHRLEQLVQGGRESSQRGHVRSGGPEGMPGVAGPEPVLQCLTERMEGGSVFRAPSQKSPDFLEELAHQAAFAGSGRTQQQQSPSSSVLDRVPFGA